MKYTPSGLTNKDKLPIKRKDFSQESYDHFLRVHLLKADCPHCHSPLVKKHATYKRHFYFSRKKDSLLMVQRLKCTSCKRTHVVLPPMAIPFKRYTMNFLVSVLSTIQAKSLYLAQKHYDLCASYLRYIMKQFHSWHQIGVNILRIHFPPKDIHAFSIRYKTHFRYDFMQILPMNPVNHSRPRAFP